jgi:hypothetical protein
MRYYYKGKFRKGWPSTSYELLSAARGWSGRPVLVRPSPSSSPSSASTVPRKALPWWSMTTSGRPLRQKLYYSLLRQQEGRTALPGAKKDCQFSVINFVDVEPLPPCQPHTKHKYIPNSRRGIRDRGDTCWSPCRRARRRAVAAATSSSRPLPLTSSLPASLSSSTTKREPYDARMATCSEAEKGLWTLSKPVSEKPTGKSL